jgi:hypothetical protein
MGYFVANIQAASFLASASLTCALAGMGTGPQTPPPPLMILPASLSAAPLSLAYLAAMSLNDGPTTFLSTAWQAMQFLELAKAGSAKAGVLARAAAQRAKVGSIFFMIFSFSRLAFAAAGSKMIRLQSI